jgi:tetratricopeptide (TPR) repeat protein
MVEQVPFINRDNELVQIEALIRERGTRRVLCIQAPGGIGKTRLLQEVQERFAKDTLIPGIIDFDDLALRIPGNIEFTIAKQIGQDTFSVYWESLQAYHQLREEGVSPGRLAQKKLEVRQAFLDDFNEFSTQQRVVLLLDTTDTLEGTEAWSYIVTELSQRLKNHLLIAAGRNAKKVYEELQSKISRDAQFIELSRLDAEASESYLRQKQKLLHVTLEPKLAEKLLLLAGGRPILIDLAVEWLAREIPLDWLIESSLQDLESLSADEMKQRRKEFERQLVLHIAQIRISMDRLTLVMSRVYPLDMEMIAELLKMPEDEARALFEEAKTYVFVKSLPDGSITLHDEMRRMVNEHVWPEVDPDGTRRRRDSELAVACLERKAQTLQAQIDQPEDEAQGARTQEDVAIDPFSQREILKQRLWTLKTRALHHRMYLDPNQGFAEFDRLILEASDRRDSDFCIMLKETAEKHRGSLSKENRIWLDLSERLLAILKGDLETAVDLIQKGLRLLEELKVKKELDRIYNSLGYCYRLQGKWELAVDSYERALHYSRLEDDAKQIAETMNNIANVCRFNGDFERGLRYTKTSLKIREKLGGTLSIANSCYVRGMILWEIGNAAEAATYLKRAQKLYRELDDQVRIAWVDKYTGYFHYRIGDVDTATEYLERAAAVFRERNVKDELADTLNMLSRVTRRRNVTGRAEEAIFEEAKKYAMQGLEIAQEIGDHYKTAECNLTLCALYYRWGKEHQIHGRHNQAKEYYSQVQKRYEEGFPIAREGNYIDLLSVYRMAVGNVAYEEGQLAYKPEDETPAIRKWDEAFGHYLEECRIAASYKEIRFDRALSEIASQLMKLPSPELTHKYCNDLIYQWKKRGLEYPYPQLVAECEQVKAFLDASEKSVVGKISQAQTDLLAMGDWQGTVEAGWQVLEHSRVYLRNPTVVNALNAGAFALRQLGRFSEARRLCTQSLHIGEVIGDQAVVAESHYVMGTIHWIVGNTAEAATHLRIARELFEDEKSKDPVGAARVRRYEGFLYYRIGNLEKAITLLEEARICFEEHKQDEHRQLADLADVLALESRVLVESERYYEEAKQKAERANEIARRIGNNYVIAETLIGLYGLNFREGRIAQESGNQEMAAHYFNLAQQCLQEGTKLAHRFGYDLLISVYEKIAGDIAFDEGRLAQAFEHYVAALEHGASFEYARLHRTLDPCIDNLVKLPTDQIRYYADYVIREWKARGLDAEFPDVVNTFELIKEYREYVYIQPKEDPTARPTNG